MRAAHGHPDTTLDEKARSGREAAEFPFLLAQRAGSEAPRLGKASLGAPGWAGEVATRS